MLIGVHQYATCGSFTTEEDMKKVCFSYSTLIEIIIERIMLELVYQTLQSALGCIYSWAVTLSSGLRQFFFKPQLGY